MAGGVVVVIIVVVYRWPRVATLAAYLATSRPVLVYVNDGRRRAKRASGTRASSKRSSARLATSLRGAGKLTGKFRSAFCAPERIASQCAQCCGQHCERLRGRVEMSFGHG